MPSSPMTREQLEERAERKRAKERRLEKTVQNIANNIWEQFGTVQRKSLPGADRWIITEKMDDEHMLKGDVFIKNMCERVNTHLATLIKDGDFPYEITEKVRPKRLGNAITVTFVRTFDDTYSSSDASSSSD